MIETLEVMPRRTGAHRTVSAEDQHATPERLLLAALAAGAGLVHAAMVPSHMGEWAVEGIAFALVAWFQFALALALLSRPLDPIVPYVAIASSLVLAGLWALSRTQGLPLGPDSGIKEQAFE